MKFRRRRGLGGFRWPWSGRSSGESGGPEAGGPDDARTGGEEGPGGGGGPGGRGGRRRRSRGRGRGGGPWWRNRWIQAAALTLVLFVAGYVVAANLIFPGGQRAEAGEVVQVPDLVGLGRSGADRSLTEAGLTLAVSSSVAHPEAPAGAIVAQTPLPGQYARPGAPVEVTLSSGPDRRRVPDLRGLSARQGQIVLERLGFRTAVDSSRSPARRGQIVGTRPDAGTELGLPAQVTLLVSEGPRTAEVPDLSGRHVEDVPTILRDAGLDLGDVTYEPDAFQAAGRVIAQSPPPGYALRRGGTVSIRVAGPAPREGRGAIDSAGTGGADSAGAGGARPGRSPDGVVDPASPAGTAGPGGRR